MLNPKRYEVSEPQLLRYGFSDISREFKVAAVEKVLDKSLSVTDVKRDLGIIDNFPSLLSITTFESNCS